MNETLAKLGLGVTGSAAVIAWLQSIEVVLRVGAALVAFVVGIFTALYYYEAWRKVRRERQ